VTSAEGDVLFIDEIHTLVGAGGGRRCHGCGQYSETGTGSRRLEGIGATDEYQKYFEKTKHSKDVSKKL
jgi:ATP-dependent Clp protease ATP-binding subunit ClpA